MVYILVCLAFISSGLLFIILLGGLFWKKQNVHYRLAQIGQGYEENIILDDRKRLPFQKRVVVPIGESFKRLIGKITPEGIKYELEKQLRAANFPFGFGVTGWLSFKIAFSVVLPFVFLLFLYFNPMRLMVKIFLFAIFTACCILFPSVVLKGRIKNRRKKIEQQLPDILDLLTVSVEAGLGFEGALAQVVKKSKGELSQEFGRMLQEMELGKTRREALSDMSKRCEIGDVKIFTSSMIQAEQLGVSIGKVLRIQSEQMRNKRRQRAQEQAMKAPVKMIIPMVMFIFPSIFIVILGPAMIQIKKFF